MPHLFRQDVAHQAWKILFARALGYRPAIQHDSSGRPVLAGKHPAERYAVLPRRGIRGGHVLDAKFE